MKLKMSSSWTRHLRLQFVYFLIIGFALIGWDLLCLITTLLTIIYVILEVQGANFIFNDKPNYKLCKIGCHPEWVYEFVVQPNHILYPIVKNYSGNVDWFRWYRYCPGCGLLETKVSILFNNFYPTCWFVMADVNKKDVLIAHYIKEWIL